MRRTHSLLAALSLLTVANVAAAQTTSTDPDAGTGAATPTSGPDAGTPSTTPATTDGTEGMLVVDAPPVVPRGQTTMRSGPGAPNPPPANLTGSALPIVEVHGYLRARFELFDHLTLGWEGTGMPPSFVPSTEAVYNGANLPWYRNPDYTAQFCYPDPGVGQLGPRPGSCGNSTQTSANMRLRLNPELHPTEFIAVYAQLDLLDNLVLGSTPQGYTTANADTRSTWAPISALSMTQVAPSAGINSWTDSIVVKRAWAEVTNQTLGQIRFGRMPSHWGLGILWNSGNTQDSDYQTDVDRVMYTLRFRPWGIFAAAMWDFPGGGATSQTHFDQQGQPYDVSLFDDTHQWSLAVGRRLDTETQRAALARGEIVVNGGLWFSYRTQFLSGEGNSSLESCSSTYATQCGATYVRRDANLFIPDLWVQLLGQDFRVEAEFVYMRGSILNSSLTQGMDIDRRYTISQFGGALEAELRLLNNRLTIGFKSGFGSGDPDQEGLNYYSGLRPQARGDTTLSMFRFHPDYRIDLLFWRSIMKQISGAYYFRPTIQYNFIDEPGSDLVFGRVDLIWSRASEFVQTRGNHADLGVEIDATLQYQSHHARADGTSGPPVPGFYATAQYGVFFPLGGLGPRDDERMTSVTFTNFNLQTAQTVRGYLGVVF